MYKLCIPTSLYFEYNWLAPGRGKFKVDRPTQPLVPVNVWKTNYLFLHEIITYDKYLFYI